MTGLSVKVFLNRCFTWFFCSFVFITVFLPGGTLYGYNFKYPLYVGLLPLSVYSAFSHHQIKATQSALILGVPAVLSSWVILGLSHGFNVAGVLRQFTDVLLTFLLCWLAQVFCNRQESRRLTFLSLVLYAEIAAAMLKIGVIAYAIARGVPVVQMVVWLNTVFGVDLMTMDLGALLGRIQFISDELVPICIYVILRHRDRLGIGSGRASLSILLLLISVLFGFSRYLWAFTALAFVLGLMLGRRDRFQAVLVGVLGISFLVSLPALTALYKLRFSADVAGSSDVARNEQIPALEQFFAESPIFGHGLGSYTTKVIRANTESGRSSYEVQLVAVLGQMGLAGVFFFSGLGAYYYRGLWWESTLSAGDRIGLSLLLVFWIAAGFTNPLLFHPISGVNYACLAALSVMAANKKSGLEDQARTLHQFTARGEARGLA